MPKSERKKKIKLWPSGKSGAQKQGDTDGIQEMPTKLSEIKSQSGKYYQSIGKLPLYKFVLCQQENNLQYLVISGSPSEKELAYAWSDLSSQYMDAMGDAEYKHYVTTYKDLTKIELTIETVEAAIECLKCFPNTDLIEFLNKTLNTKFKFDYTKKEEYDKNLKRCYQRSRTLIVQRDLLRIKFQAISKKFEGDKQADPDYYPKCLISLSDHAGYRVTDRITVFEFCERMRRMIAHYEKQNLRPNGSSR